MTTTRLGLVAFATLGVWMMVAGGGKVAGSLNTELGSWYTIYGAMQIPIGVLLLRYRQRISDYLFRVQDVAIEEVDIVDAQIATLALLGVWFMVGGAAGLATACGSWNEHSPGIAASGGVSLLLGGALACKGGFVTRMWSKSPLATTQIEKEGE